MNSPPSIADDKMIAVGFDVGNDNCVIATVRKGVVNVLLNDEPSRVSFSDKKRFIGSSASSLLNPSSTFSEIKDLLLSQPGGSHHIPFIKKEITVTNVHLLGMLLSRLKLITERSLGIPVYKCVISLPSFADQSERQAYLLAAQLAGLEPLHLIHDTTATALAYGIYEADFSDGEIRVVFVDVGQCHTQVSVVAFNSDGLRVLSHAADRRLGGRDFDEILFKHFAEQFKDEYKIDVSSNAKASLLLKAACEKVKKDLSANGEASMIIESLMDGKDIKGFIKREEFEKLASGLLQRVLLPCKNALSDAHVGLDEVQSVELVGSASAIPAITEILSSFFGKEPSRTLNARECVARGCALQCAMLTPGFKIKNYQVDSQSKRMPCKLVSHEFDMELGGGLTLRDFCEARLLEMEISYQNDPVESRKQDLRYYVWDTQVELWETYNIFATGAELEEISNRLKETERWLKDEKGIAETENVYNDELLKLKKLMEPIVNRFIDVADRPHAIRELVQCIADNKLAAESWPTHERDAAFNECNKAEQWLQDKIQLQNSLPMSSDPAVWSHEIEERTASLNALCFISPLNHADGGRR